MIEYKQGQRLKVSFETVVDRVSNTGGINFSTPGGTYLYVLPRMEDYTIEVMDPAEWPPEIGDIWKVECQGKTYEYFARTRFLSPNIRMDAVDDTGDVDTILASQYSQTTLDAFKALNPKLVRRREK